jgi:hypothetical protein
MLSGSRERMWRPTSKRPSADPSIMISGFILYFVAAALRACLLWKSSPALPGYQARFTHLLLVGVFAVLLIDIGDADWWRISWAWKLTQAAYNVAAVAAGAAVLAHFIKVERSQA